MKMVVGTVLLIVLGAGCATSGDYAVSALVRGDDVRIDATRVKVDLAEILTP